MRTISLIIITAALSVSLFLKSYDFVAGNYSTEINALTQAERDAILQGADPSEILEQTAAGNAAITPNEFCRFGQIVGQQQAESLNGHYYVALRQDEITYIQVSPLVPVYLKQNAIQAVSARVFTPDDELRQQLDHYFSKREGCTSADLFLQRLDQTTAALN